MLDGTDTIAVLIDRVTVFSVGEAIMVINGIIIAAAGFVFGWENALYSLIAYFVAHKAIDVTVEGLMSRGRYGLSAIMCEQSARLLIRPLRSR